MGAGEAGSPAQVRAPTGQVPGPWGSSIDDSHREHSTKVSPVILNENTIPVPGSDRCTVPGKRRMGRAPGIFTFREESCASLASSRRSGRGLGWTLDDLHPGQGFEQREGRGKILLPMPHRHRGSEQLVNQGGSRKRDVQLVAGL